MTDDPARTFPTLTQLPAGDEASPSYIVGWRLFQNGHPLAQCATEESRVAWWHAHRLAYAQGWHAVLSNFFECRNPYPQFTPAGEAWTDGAADSEAYLTRHLTTPDK